MKRSMLIEGIAILFMVLFLYTGASKLMDYDVFTEQIGASPILEPVSTVVAWALPAVEFIVSIALFIPSWRLRGLYGALGLMIIFTGYVAALLLLSKNLPCSCGGILALLSWKGHLIFNSVMILLALSAIRLSKEHRINRHATALG